MKPGDRVRWRGVNRDYTGEVITLTPRGTLVRLEGSDKCIILSIPKPKE